MQQTPKIFIPQQEDSQQSRTNSKVKNKPPRNTRCQRFCIIVACLLLLILLGLGLSIDQKRVYVKLCDVYDCTNEVRTVGRRKQSIETTPTNSNDKNESQSSKKTRWQLQKIVWMYKPQTATSQSHEKQLFTKLNSQNTKHFAALSGFQIRYFSLSSYNHHLSNQSLQKINQVKSQLQTKKQSLSTSKQTLREITQNEQLVQQHLITYLLLLEHGGVFVDSNVTIVEPFETWLEVITTVPYVNMGNKMNPHTVKPKCFAFFDNDYSSLRLKANVMREYEFEKKLVAFPGFEEGFLACEKGSQFIGKLVEVYVEILIEGKESKRWQLMNKDQELIGKTNPGMPYQDGHLIASHIVLQQRQAQLLNLPSPKQTIDISQLSTAFTPLAIDSFGLITINNNLGPHKFKHIFLHQEKCYSYLTKLSMEDMEKTMGKVRFVAKLTPYVQWKLGRHLIEGSNEEVYFASESFVHNYFLRFLPNSEKEMQTELGLKQGPKIINFQTNPSQNINNPLWNALPNTLWVIWDKGLERHSKPIIELCYANLKRSAQASNFSIKVVSNKNLQQYISQELRQKIQTSIQNAKQPVSSQTISDFWRLAIIYQNGGVYVDASTFTTCENLDFIRNITRIPSNMLWNRYGTEPEVFIFWNTLLGSPTNWHFDFQRNTKVQWHLSYESNFIAAIKNSEFMKEWLDVFMEWMTLPYEQIFRQMSSVGMQDYKWTKTKDRYLMVMDAVKYVAGRRQQLIKQSPNPTYQSAADYYKIWSVSGQSIGQQKFRGQYNFQSRDYRLDYMDQQILNLYKTEYSWEYAQELLGSFEYQTKFFGLDLRESGFLWDNFYRDHKNNFSLQNFEQIIHPESVFGKLLLYRDRNLTSNLMKYYNELAVTRLRLKTTKMTGL